MVIITGASSGIGKALAEIYLHQGQKVIGISRTNSIKNELFEFIPCDLTKVEDLKRLLQKLPDYFLTNEKVTLINNAGIIGDIKASKDLTLEHYLNVSTVNIVALQAITSSALAHLKEQQLNAIVNISSGAGRRAIPSWSAYCASKAAVDLFSETVKAELLEQGNELTKIYALAPGVVDTQMQSHIRKSNEADFSSLSNFKKLKKENNLKSPKEVAQQIIELLKLPQQEVINRLT